MPGLRSCSGPLQWDTNEDVLQFPWNLFSGTSSSGDPKTGKPTLTNEGDIEGTRGHNFSPQCMSVKTWRLN